MKGGGFINRTFHFARSHYLIESPKQHRRNSVKIHSLGSVKIRSQEQRQNPEGMLVKARCLPFPLL